MNKHGLKWSLRLILPLIMLLSAVIPCHSPAATYYIDAEQGDDSAAGVTESQPWKSLGHVSSRKFLPGDRILFRRGRTWHGSLTVTSSGALKNPILISCYGPESEPAPLFSGLYAVKLHAPLRWTRVTGNIYRADYHQIKGLPGVLVYQNTPLPPVTSLKFSSMPASPSPGAVLLQLDNIYRSMLVTSVRHNIISGYTLRPFDSRIRVHARQADNSGREVQWKHTLPPPQTVRDMKSLTAPGSWYMDPDRKALFICSRVPPSEVDIRPGYEKWGIRLVNCGHVRVENIWVKGFGETGVWVHNGYSVILDNLNVWGTGCAGHRTGILLFNSRDCTVSNCTVDSSLGNGIVLYAYPGETTPAGSSSNRITQNRVLRSGAAGISLSTDAENMSYLVTGNIIEKNRIEHSNTFAYDAAGIYLLNSGKDNVIQENTVRDGGNDRLRSAGVMLDGGVSPTLVQGNLLEANSLAGIALNGRSHTIVQNTIRDNGALTWDSAQVILFPVQINASGCVIQHNSMECGPGQKLVMKTAIPGKPELPHDIDFNTYIASDSQPFCWSDSWTCGRWVNFTAWKSLTGQDKHSTFHFKRQ